VITCIFGKPGSGKSYEAVRFHVIGALKRDRMVITNLPLKVELLSEEFPAAGDLLVVRQNEGAVRAFSREQDYDFDWRHDSGFGPLFVVDECHFVYPIRSVSGEEGRFLRWAEEWYSMHRHKNIDVVLITQSYGKIVKTIRDMVELWIGVRNNKNLGFSSTYRRFAGDEPRGIEKEGRGEVRKYDPRIFRYYQSYTLGGKGKEMAPTDVRPIWRHPVFYLLGFLSAVLIFMVATDRFHPLAPLFPAPAPNVQVVVPAPVPLRLDPPRDGSGSVSAKPEAPKPPPAEAAVVGHIGVAQLIRAGDQTKTLSAWLQVGVVVTGVPGRCPWSMVLGVTTFSGRC